MPKKKTMDEFVHESKMIYNEQFEYLTEYNGYDNPITLVCKIHGKFEQTPRVHLRGHGCPYCVGNVKKTTEEFIKESNVIHAGYYQYKNTVYVQKDTPLIVTCPFHGDFYVYPKVHLSGGKCTQCTGRAKLTTEKFIEKSIIKHGMKYNYSSVVYGKNNKEKVILICPDHGNFSIRPNDHLSGKGCKICADKNVVSKAVLEIEKILIEHNISFIREHIFPDCKNINVLRFDFYIPEHNLVIEYDGAQHFIAFEHWGGNAKLEITQQNDRIKNKYCNDNNIKILRIKYTQNHTYIVTRNIEECLSIKQNYMNL